MYQSTKIMQQNNITYYFIGFTIIVCSLNVHSKKTKYGFLFNELCAYDN